MKKFYLLFLIVIICIFNLNVVYADVENINLETPEIFGESYILVDGTTGRVLLARNEDKKMYPASITKLVTALVAVEYIEPDELIEIGYEVNEIPWDSSIAGHKPNELILFENLLRGLLIPSGNDSASTIAMEVSRRYTKNDNITYDEAKIVFAKLMNEKAKELGANNTNFVSVHGYHDENHYSTASDIMLFAEEALKNDLIREICGEKIFEGYGAGDKRTVDMFTQEYVWDNTNALLGGRMTLSDYAYKNATGVKTGSTSDAGSCLISSAENADGVKLVAVVLKSQLPDVWYDSQKLLDYGFKNYSNIVLDQKGSMVKEVLLDNNKLIESDVLELITSTEISVLLSEDEINKVTRNITINEDRASNKNTDTALDTTLVAPISRGETIGVITYSLDNVEIASANIVAKNDVEKRTLASDFAYYGTVMKNILFSWLIIPISVTIILLTLFGVRGYNIMKKKNERRKRSQKYRFKTKY